MSFKVAELYSGGTRLCLVQGRALANLSAGLYTDANTRGVMGAGLAADIRRAAGAEVERELRAHGHLLVGESYLTSSGALVEHGVTAIAHGVVISERGVTPALDLATRALLSGLRQLEEAGCRSVTIPQIGWRVASLDHNASAVELANVTLTHLRRQSRLESVTIVSLHHEYLDVLADAVRRQTQDAS